MSKNKVYKNKNGNMGIDEWLVLIHDGKLEDYLRYGKTCIHKCPPFDLIVNQQCFYCIDCKKDSYERIKKTKTGYKVSRKTYKFDEVEKMAENVVIPDFKQDAIDLQKSINSK